MLFLWGLVGAALGVLLLLYVPFTLETMLHWPGYSEMQVRVGPVTLSRSHQKGPRQPSLHPPGRSGKGKGGGPPISSMLAAFRAMFDAIDGSPVQRLELDAEGGVGDPAITAVLYGGTWAVLEGLLAAAGQQARISLTPRLDGPAGGRLTGSAAIRVIPLQLLTAVLKAMRSMRRAS